MRYILIKDEDWKLIPMNVEGNNVIVIDIPNEIVISNVN